MGVIDWIKETATNAVEFVAEKADEMFNKQPSSSVTISEPQATKAVKPTYTPPAQVSYKSTNIGDLYHQGLASGGAAMSSVGSGIEMVGQSMQAKTTLYERYAAGDISRDEYRNSVGFFQQPFLAKYESDGLAYRASKATTEAIAGGIEYAGKSIEDFYKIGADYSQSELIPYDELHPLSPSRAARLTIEGVGSMAPATAVATSVALTTKNPVASMRAFQAVMFGQMKGDAAEEFKNELAIERGVHPSALSEDDVINAGVSSTLSGTIESAFERIIPGVAGTKLFKAAMGDSFKKTLYNSVSQAVINTSKNVVGSGIGESITEFSQAVTRNIIAKERGISEEREILEGAVESGVKAFFPGMFFGAAGSVATGMDVKQSIDAKDVEGGESIAQNKGKIIDTTTTTKINEGGEEVGVTVATFAVDADEFEAKGGVHKSIVDSTIYGIQNELAAQQLDGDAEFMLEVGATNYKTYKEFYEKSVSTLRSVLDGKLPKEKIDTLIKERLGSHDVVVVRVEKEYADPSIDAELVATPLVNDVAATPNADAVRYSDPALTEATSVATAEITAKVEKPTTKELPTKEPKSTEIANDVVDDVYTDKVIETPLVEKPPHLNNKAKDKKVDEAQQTAKEMGAISKLVYDLGDALKKDVETVLVNVKDRLAMEASMEVTKEMGSHAVKLLKASEVKLKTELEANISRQELVLDAKVAEMVLMMKTPAVQESYTNGPNWYKKFYKENDGAPNTEELYDIADKEIRRIAVDIPTADGLTQQEYAIALEKQSVASEYVKNGINISLQTSLYAGYTNDNTKVANRVTRYTALYNVAKELEAAISKARRDVNNTAIMKGYAADIKLSETQQGGVMRKVFTNLTTKQQEAYNQGAKVFSDFVKDPYILRRGETGKERYIIVDGSDMLDKTSGNNPYTIYERLAETADKKDYRQVADYEMLLVDQDKALKQKRVERNVAKEALLNTKQYNDVVQAHTITKDRMEVIQSTYSGPSVLVGAVRSQSMIKSRAITKASMAASYKLSQEQAKSQFKKARTKAVAKRDVVWQGKLDRKEARRTREGQAYEDRFKAQAEKALRIKKDKAYRMRERNALVNNYHKTYPFIEASDIKKLRSSSGFYTMSDAKFDAMLSKKLDPQIEAAFQVLQRTMKAEALYAEKSLKNGEAFNKAYKYKEIKQLNKNIDNEFLENTVIPELDNYIRVIETFSHGDEILPEYILTPQFETRIADGEFWDESQVMYTEAEFIDLIMETAGVSRVQAEKDYAQTKKNGFNVIDTRKGLGHLSYKNSVAFTLANRLMKITNTADNMSAADIMKVTPMVKAARLSRTIFAGRKITAPFAGKEVRGELKATKESELIRQRTEYNLALIEEQEANRAKREDEGYTEIESKSAEKVDVDIQFWLDSLVSTDVVIDGFMRAPVVLTNEEILAGVKSKQDYLNNMTKAEQDLAIYLREVFFREKGEFAALYSGTFLRENYLTVQKKHFEEILKTKGWGNKFKSLKKFLAGTDAQKFTFEGLVEDDKQGGRIPSSTDMWGHAQEQYTDEDASIDIGKIVTNYSRSFYTYAGLTKAMPEVSAMAGILSMNAREAENINNFFQLQKDAVKGVHGGMITQGSLLDRGSAMARLLLTTKVFGGDIIKQITVTMGETVTLLAAAAVNPLNVPSAMNAMMKMSIDDMARVVGYKPKAAEYNSTQRLLQNNLGTIGLSPLRELTAIDKGIMDKAIGGALLPLSVINSSQKRALFLLMTTKEERESGAMSRARSAELALEMSTILRHDKYSVSPKGMTVVSKNFKHFLTWPINFLYNATINSKLAATKVLDLTRKEKRGAHINNARLTRALIVLGIQVTTSLMAFEYFVSLMREWLPDDEEEDTYWQSLVRRRMPELMIAQSSVLAIYGKIKAIENTIAETFLDIEETKKPLEFLETAQMTDEDRVWAELRGDTQSIIFWIDTLQKQLSSVVGNYAKGFIADEPSQAKDSYDKANKALYGQLPTIVKGALSTFGYQPGQVTANENSRKLSRDLLGHPFGLRDVEKAAYDIYKDLDSMTEQDIQVKLSELKNSDLKRSNDIYDSIMLFRSRKEFTNEEKKILQGIESSKTVGGDSYSNNDGIRGNAIAMYMQTLSSDEVQDFAQRLNDGPVAFGTMDKGVLDKAAYIYNNEIKFTEREINFLNYNGTYDRPEILADYLVNDLKLNKKDMAKQLNVYLKAGFIDGDKQVQEVQRYLELNGFTFKVE